MINILILEDNEERMKQFKQNIPCLFVHTDNSKKCIQLLQETKFDVLFLDHDLGGNVYVKSGENTGWEVAKWLNENPHHQPEHIILHSLNPDGVKQMKQELPNAHIIPFAWQKQLIKTN